MSAAVKPPRPCRLCGELVPVAALVEAHVGPTRRLPHADLVVWLCPACTVQATDQPADGGKHPGGQP